MAGGMYRGTAFAQLVQQLLRGQYYGGFGEGGEFQKILGSLAESSAPIFEDIMKGYWGTMAREGQAVPGEGISGAGYEGFEDLMKEFASELTGTALGAYQMPWQAAFGTAPTAETYITAKKTRQEEAMAPWTIGAQTTGGTGGCAFMFTETNNGMLDRIARRYRDEYGTTKQAIGYKLMSAIMVPYMKKYRFVKWLVKYAMVKPMIWWGKAFYGENWHGHIFWPFKCFWFDVYEFLGEKYIKEFRRWIAWRIENGSSTDSS